MDFVALLNLIIELLPANIFWKDRSGRFLGCNMRQARSDGFKSPGELIGKNVYETCREKVFADKIFQVDEEVMSSGRPLILEEEGFDDERKHAIYLSHKVPIVDKQNKVVGLLGVALDITAHKEAERREKEAQIKETAAAKAKAKAEEELRQAVMILAGSIVHDLRSPLATISTYADVLKEEIPKLLNVYNQAPENLLGDNAIAPFRLHRMETTPDKIIEAEQSANEFINVTLKTLSRVLTGELTESDLVICSIRYCIVQTLDRYPFEKEETKLIHHDTAHDFTFLGNSLLVSRILINLIKNSLYQINKNQRGEIFIYVQGDERANYLKIKDTAGGANPEIIASLFAGYRTTKAEGTGVGLAFCKQTMQSFGGDITCESIEGDFIEFTLSFPLIADS